MKVVFIEVVRGFLKNSYKELGQKKCLLFQLREMLFKEMEMTG